MGRGALLRLHQGRGQRGHRQPPLALHSAENHLEEFFEETSGQEIEDVATTLLSPDAPPAADALPTAGEETLKEDNSRKSKDWISRNGRQNRDFFSSGPRKRSADRLVSTTDPDATPMRLGSEGQTKLGYQAHYVVDGDKVRVILNVLVTPSEVSENRPMLDLLWRTAFRWRLWPDQVTGDAKYGTRQNVSAFEKAGIRAYVAIPNFDFRHTGLFGAGHFRYDPEKDLYVCPADEHLHRHARTSGDRGTRYRAKAQACNACELKKRCTDSENGRTIYRRPDEDYYERVRAYRGSFPYEKALRKRRVWVEPLFAEAKDSQGMRKFRLRRLEKVNIEALLIASGQNIKRLLAFGGRRPKKPAQAAALRPPSATEYKIRRAREHRSNCSWQPTKAFFNTLYTFRNAISLPFLSPTT